MESRPEANKHHCSSFLVSEELSPVVCISFLLLYSRLILSPRLTPSPSQRSESAFDVAPLFPR